MVAHDKTRTKRLLRHLGHRIRRPGGHPFAYDYSPALDPEVYTSLLDLMAKAYVAVTDLEPRDNIDLQSLVWVVGDYKEGDGSPESG